MKNASLKLVDCVTEKIPPASAGVGVADYGYNLQQPILAAMNSTSICTMQLKAQRTTCRNTDSA